MVPKERTVWGCRSGSWTHGPRESVCILGEGDEDEALVRGAAAQRGLDLDGAGLGVIQTNGKTGMPDILAFLSLAGVTCYPVFDLDRDKKAEHEQHRSAEQQILRGLHEDGEPAPGVHASYACWEVNITRTSRDDLGDQYEGLLGAAAERYGYPQPSKASKVPVVIAEMLEGAAVAGVQSPLSHDSPTS